jgi:pimeloyl-ACP methyl ester carboxylesterase
VAVVEQPTTVWGGRVATSVQVGGQGPPLVYLHGESGLFWDAFLDALAADHTVYAIEHPGTSNLDREAVRAVDDLWDLVLCYDEILDDLGLDQAVVVGHSFGGMVAAELAACLRHRVSRLVLISPLGLWRDDAPVTNWMILPPDELVEHSFADPSGPAAGAMREILQQLVQTDPEAAVNAMWSVACTGKFVWPIPDRGLRKRLHRITAPTLVVWGGSDRIISSSYARDFGDAIAGARVEVIADGGHLLQLERPQELVAAVRGFLGS